MRAVWYEKQGPARDVLVFGEVPTPKPNQYEVLIRLHASGINPSDVKWRGGRLAAMEYLRIIPHSDGAGVVEELGPGAPQHMLGKRVWFYNGQRNGRANGTAAEFIALDANLVRELPDDVSFAEGATLGIPGMTAHVCLFAHGPVQGQTVLVTGGAGACGLYAVQLAKWAGATVITTVSGDEKADRAREGGADQIINYRTEDVTARLKELTDGQGLDYVVDVSLNTNLLLVLPVLRNGAAIACFDAGTDMSPPIPFVQLVSNNITLYGKALPRSPIGPRVRAQDDMTAWVSATKNRPNPVSEIFSLGDTVAAHEAVERGDKKGTVIVDPSK